MAGENEFGGLQSGEDPENSLKYSYEDYLADNNDLQTGFPTNKDNLTDTDYQQGNEFTNYNGGDDYAIDTSDDNDSPDEDNEFDDGYDDEDNDSYDDEDDYDEDDYDDEEDDEEDEEDDEEAEEDGAGGHGLKSAIKEKGSELVNDVRQGLAAAKGEKDPFDGFIKWRPGNPITLPLLIQVWREAVNINAIKPLIKTADTAVEQALNTIGPNLVIRLAVYLKKWGDPEAGYISGVLSIVEKFSHKLLYTSLATVEAIFDQQWTQVCVIAGLSPALEAALQVTPVKKIMTAIFMVAVPIINLKFMKKKVKEGYQAVKKKNIQHKINKRKKTKSQSS
ncbi:MAG: hypothetical protein IKT33_01375 [Clostridia bacterium]|nr:hypothetical protein [Clostridia bacterium]